jgi:hypothetical protein
MGLPRMFFSTIDADTATSVNQVAEGDVEGATWETNDSHNLEDDFEVDNILMNLASEKIKDAGEE